MEFLERSINETFIKTPSLFFSGPSSAPSHALLLPSALREGHIIVVQPVFGLISVIVLAVWNWGKTISVTIFTKNGSKRLALGFVVFLCESLKIVIYRVRYYLIQKDQFYLRTQPISTDADFVSCFLIGACPFSFLSVTLWQNRVGEIKCKFFSVNNMHPQNQNSIATVFLRVFESTRCLLGRVLRLNLALAPYHVTLTTFLKSEHARRHLIAFPFLCILPKI